jgi:hypothetical protein
VNNLINSISSKKPEEFFSYFNSSTRKVQDYIGMIQEWNFYTLATTFEEIIKRLSFICERYNVEEILSVEKELKNELEFLKDSLCKIYEQGKVLKERYPERIQEIDHNAKTLEECFNRLFKDFNEKIPALKRRKSVTFFVEEERDLNVIEVLEN